MTGSYGNNKAVCSFKFAGTKNVLRTDADSDAGKMRAKGTEETSCCGVHTPAWTGPTTRQDKPDRAGGKGRCQVTERNVL